MKSAGLTVGGFYAHFPSKDALLAEAIANTMKSGRRLAYEAGMTGLHHSSGCESFARALPSDELANEVLEVAKESILKLAHSEEERLVEHDKLLDAVVIGGGLAGIIFLKTAVEKKLSVRLLEKQADVGGTWLRLPVWQDIQMRPEDWSLNGVPILGVRQPFILENARIGSIDTN
ncbi:unnamed protein product [Sphagnum balticum]